MNEAKVRQIFELALERPAAERAEFLDRLCGTTGELRRITSYNVCYTKLLRDAADRRAVPRQAVHELPARGPDGSAGCLRIRKAAR